LNTTGKFQAPNTKSQINPNDLNSKFTTIDQPFVVSKKAVFIHSEFEMWKNEKIAEVLVIGH